MHIKNWSYFSILLSFCCCVREIDCSNLAIKPAFIGFPLADIDTLIIRKFKQGDNFQRRIDSFVVTFNNYYQTSNDTTKIVLFQTGKIEAGFDYQIFLPALNRSVNITDIFSNKKTTKCPSGTLAMDRDCECVNDLISAKMDNQVVTFQNLDREAPYVYIRR